MQQHNILTSVTVRRTSIFARWRPKLLRLAVVFLLCVMVSAAAAADRYVLPSGSNDSGNNDCLDANIPCRTIRHAVQQAFDYDVIVLMEETPDGTTTFTQSHGIVLHTNLVFQGTGPGPENIILDASSSGDRHFTIQSSGYVRFENLTLTGGESASDGGSISQLSGGTLELNRVVLHNNTAQVNGGALSIDGTLTAIETRFDANQALSGGGGAIHLHAGHVRLLSSQLTHNTADINGGGLYVETGTAELETTQIGENSAEYGGGVACRININTGTGCTNLRLDKESQFVRNTAQQSGGAIFTQAYSLIQATTFKENETTLASALAEGGAIYANTGIDDDRARLLIKMCDFEENRSGGSGGAVSAVYSDVWIRRSTFVRNTLVD